MIKRQIIHLKMGKVFKNISLKKIYKWPISTWKNVQQYYCFKKMQTKNYNQFSCSVGSDFLWPHGLWHSRLPCPSPTPGVCSNSSPLSRWCHPTISSSRPLLLPSIFPSIRVFSNESVLHIMCQSKGTSTSASAFPMNIQDWFPLGLTGLISSQSKGLSRVFSNITVQKHQFFSTQLSLWSNSHIHTWLLEKP